MFANGNAAHRSTIIVPATQRDQFIKEIADIHSLTWWNAEDGSKRRIMAECLVHRLIEPALIDAVYVANSKVAEALQASVSRSIHVIAEPHMFFEPTKAIQVTPTLSLVVGDMFFSRMQTLTVSVNTVGIMGKGLASRAKYQSRMCMCAIRMCAGSDICAWGSRTCTSGRRSRSSSGRRSLRR